MLNINKFAKCLSASLFWPVKRASRNIKFSKKVVIIISLALIPSIFILLANLNYTWKAISIEKQELHGIETLENFVTLLQNAGRHRGYTGHALTGEDSILPTIEKAETEINNVMGRLSRDTSMNYPLLEDRFASLQSEWHDLEGWRENKPDQNFNAHKAFMAHIISLTDMYAALSGIQSDSDQAFGLEADMATSILPQLRSTIGEVRGFTSSRNINNISSNSITYLHRLFIEAFVIMDRVNDKIFLLQQTQPQRAETIRDRWQIVMKNVSHAHNKIKEINDPDVLLLRKQEIIGLMTVAIKSLDDFRHSQVEDIKFNVLGSRMKRHEQLFFALVGGSVVGLVMIAWILIGLSIDIRQRLVNLKDQIKQFGEGDFTAQSEVGGSDEIGEIAKDIDAMFDDVRNLVSTVLPDSRELVRGTEVINDASRNVEQLTTMQADAAKAVTTAVHDVTERTLQISERAELTNELATKAGGIATRGRHIVGETVAKMAQIASTAQSASQTVFELGEQAKHITGFVDLIKELADQTNLLALNAAIEAARAGEHGRGFAVVADEVRRLAQNTTKSTQQIVDVITSIQSGVKNANTSMSASANEVQAGVELAESADSIISEITDMLGQVIEAAADMSVKLKEQSLAANDAASQVLTITEMSEECRIGASKSTEAVAELYRMAIELETLVVRFKISPEQGTVTLF